MNTFFKNEIKGSYRNLLNGLRLLVFKRVALKNFYFSLDQLIILVIVLSSVLYIGSFFLSFPKPEFSVYGVGTLATQLFFSALAVYCFSKLPGNNNERLLPLFILLLSLLSLFHVIWIFIGNSVLFDYWQLYGKKKYLYLIFNVWIAAVVVTAISRVLDVYGKRIIIVAIIYTFVLGIPLNYFTFGDFWHPSYNYDDGTDKHKSINQEMTYYKQFKFIERAKKNLLQQRRGITDLYFVGFGSYTSQDVFMKEVLYAKNLFDKKFDTKGRSIALINNNKTVDNTLLATKSNLSLILEHIGKLVDSNDDILFLYLTSHGSKKHKLSVTMPPLRLNSLNPAGLKKTLQQSGIKYKVILVSACYSGGFIEPLKDDYTLIFTAAAKDKTSFGCSNENDFTYFGKAVFKDNLEHNFNFISAFTSAIELIRKRESKNKVEHSNPQLFVGDKIREKILVFTNEIEKYNNDKI